MPGEEVKYQSIVKPSRAIVDIRQSRGVSRARRRLAYMLLAAWLPGLAEAQESTPPEPSPYGGNVWSRATLGGDWGGVRDRWAAMGIVVGFDVTYTFQGLASGGFDGPLFHRVSDEGDTGNTASGDLTLELDTGKAGMWEGGRFDLRVEGRAGRSVLQRAGSVSAVDNDALPPTWSTASIRKRWRSPRSPSPSTWAPA